MEVAVGEGLAGAPWAGPAAGRARGPRRRAVHVEPGRGRSLVPHLDDLRRHPGPAQRAGSGRRLRAAAGRPRVRPRAAHAADQARPARRHGHDREAGRFGRPREHHHRHRGRPTARTGCAATSGSPARPCATCSWCWPRRPAGLSCFLVPRVLAGRHPQHVPHPAPQGQAGQPQQREQRAGVRRHGRVAGRRGGPGCPDDHRDGGDDPARLRHRIGVRHAGRADPGDPSHPAPRGVRRAAQRQAADAQRAGRHGAGVGGRDRAGDAPGRRGGPWRARVPPACHRGGQVLGVQAAARPGRRGARVPGRQRVRRGVRVAPALPGRTAQLDLGGLGQRPGPRRVAYAAPRAGQPGRVPRRGAARRPARTGASTTRSTSSRTCWPTPRRSRHAGSSNGWPWCCRPRCSSGTHPAATADAFCASRLGGDWGRAFGTLPRGLDLQFLVQRAAPA